MRILLNSFLCAAVLQCLIVASLPAQTAGSGSIVGRVFNPGTGEYVRNAQVTLDGTDRTVDSERGGTFRFTNVPAGPASVTVRFAGYKPATMTVEVSPGEVARPEIEIVSLDAPESEGDVIRLGEFVIASEREGNSKAIMNQRNSMNVSRTVASDVFGDVTEGNVGEFLKYLPGVELEYVEADTRGPRLGGMDPQYAGVSVDGMKLASADAFIQFGSTENGSTGSGSRSFGFEQVSINSIESIEINRVAAADMDADAPAGTINLRTKRAFDTKGRRITWNLSTVLNTEEFKLGSSLGPHDGTGRKFKPNYSFNFSDSFFDNRLGILVGISESNLYNEQYRIDHTYNRSPTAGDPRPQVLTSINFKDGPKWTKRFTTTLTADFKATEDLVLSLSSTFHAYDARFYNRTAAFQAATNNTNATTGRQFAVGDGLNTFATGDGAVTGRRVTLGGGNGVKLTNSVTIVPKFEYNRGGLRIEGAFAYSRSKNDYDNLARGTGGNAAVNPLDDVGFTATRSGAHEADWQITQTSGPDWADLGNYTNPRINDDARFALNQVYTGELNARFTLPIEVPTWVKVGGKMQERIYDFSRRTAIMNWAYIGPSGDYIANSNGTFTGTGTYADFASPFNFDMGQTGGQFTSISGAGAPRFGNRDELAGLLKTNPEQFIQSFTADNYFTAIYGDTREYDETVTAGYAMANTRLGRWQVQGGLRWEKTETASKEFDPLPASDVVDAGYTVYTSGTNAGRANTVPGLQYQYESRPRVTRKGEYDNYFPNITGKFNIAENLIADFGFGKAIKRPDINHISGVWSINEIAETIRLPNPNLKPELSDKFVAALGYYFGGAGNLTLTLSHTSIKNLRRETDYTAEEFGNTDPELANYTFISGTSDGPEVDFRSLELSYSQPLGFLPDALRGTSIFASYARTYASERRPGITPHTMSGGIEYSYKRLRLGFKAVWQDEAPWTNTVGRFRHRNTKYDFGGEFKLTSRMSLYFQGRNVFETPHRIFEEIGGNDRVLWRLENYGSNWTFGMKGTF